MIITDQQRQQVVERARAQVGKPYVFGSSGPHDYDCSGSALDAWRGIVDLPHNTGLMVRWLQARAAGSTFVPAGHYKGKAARAAMQPGDLAFYYGDVSRPDTVSHCAVYVGATGGARWVVNATNEQRGVELIRLFQYARPVAFGLVGHE